MIIQYRFNFDFQINFLEPLDKKSELWEIDNLYIS